MSTDIVVRQDHGYKLSKFYGGDDRGKMIQITPLSGDLPADAYLVATALNPAAVAQLVEDLTGLCLDDPTPGELGAAVAELGEDRDRLFKEAEAARAQAAEFEEDLRETRQELEEQKAAARELFDEAKRAQQEAAEAREELRAAGVERRKLKEETEVLGKELAHARESREKVERDLSRALGYIDRVVEDEPPVKDPVTVINRHCGDIGESFTTGTPRRGPVLSGSDPWR